MTRLCVLSLLVTCATAGSLACSETLDAPRANSIRIGMSRRELKQDFGPPTHISRLVLFRRHLEQWHYVEPPRWVEFNVPRGEEAVVNRFSGDGK